MATSSQTNSQPARETAATNINTPMQQNTINNTALDQNQSPTIDTVLLSNTTTLGIVSQHIPFQNTTSPHLPNLNEASKLDEMSQVPDSQPEPNLASPIIGHIIQQGKPTNNPTFENVIGPSSAMVRYNDKEDTSLIGSLE